MKKNGICIEYDEFNRKTFIGKYLYGERIEGEIYIDGNLEYKGEFLYDRKFNGKGYDKNKKIIYELNKGNGKVKE